MKEEIIPYKSESTTCQGYVAYDSEKMGKKPAIMVAHAFRGQDDFARKKAKQLAEMGYIGFAIDIYGEGAFTEDLEKASEWMLPYFFNRNMLRERMKSAYEALLNFSPVDKEKIGAMGYCFGGLAVLELIRSGLDVKGGISFHGVLGDSIGGKKAQEIPSYTREGVSLLILHGYEDPLVSRDDIEKIEKEMTERKVDWQIHIYGHTVHAFTNPELHDFSHGMAYNEKAAHRAWLSARNFFNEVLR